MQFNIKRVDRQNFRNFVVQVGDEYLIDRNEDFYSELSEWVDGVLTLMKNGSAYFSAPRGFTPFFGNLEGNNVEFERMDGLKVNTDFFLIVRDTIIFLCQQSKEEKFFERDSVFFERRVEALLAGFRFRFKEEYKRFLEYLKSKELLSEDHYIL